MAFPSSLPAPTNTPLRGGPTLRWGIIGPGQIANDFVTSIHEHSDQHAVAVGSRSIERAQAFASKLGVDRAYGSYEEVVGDPDVDIVYIGSPHSEHREHALLAIAAGKHVLCEKPIALSAREATDIAEAARAAGVFVMEAMWTRFLPKFTVIKQLLDDGVLGTPGVVIADLGFRAEFNPEGRMFNPALGGGGLLDLGVYPVWFAQFALGKPSAVHAFGTLASTGVDQQVSMGLEYEGRAQATIVVSLLADTGGRALIAGSDGRIDVHPMFIGPGGFTLSGGGQSLEFVDETGFQWRDGLCWQAAAVAQHVADGLTEAPEHPLSATIAQLETIDAARTFAGYPPA
jgi:predicted dehydrogenase